MALVCPECRTVATSDQSRLCEACGYRFTEEDRKPPLVKPYIIAAIVFGIATGLVFAARSC
jgi:uncharacterized paraquat-inducible protein A